MKILFVGNRIHVLNKLFQSGNHQIEIYAIKGSFLESELKILNKDFTSFEISDKNLIIKKIKNGDFDVFISNGCPFIIPVSEIEHSKLLINIHPTYLPQLRGKTPLNGVFFNEMRYIGATMHFISDTIDGGNIIYQKKVKLTKDFDQGLVYFTSFKLESDVFEKGWELIIKKQFRFNGFPQNIEKGSYFNRTPEKMIIDFSNMPSDEIIKRTKSFGIDGQGCKVENLKSSVLNVVYDAEKIVNPYLLNLFSNEAEGQILLNYDSKFLIKTIDGIIKVSRYESK